MYLLVPESLNPWGSPCKETFEPVLETPKEIILRYEKK